MCIDNRQLAFQVEKPSKGINEELKGHKFYRFVNAQKQTDLQVGKYS